MAAGSAAVASTARRLRISSNLGARLKPFVFLDLKPTSSAIEGEGGTLRSGPWRLGRVDGPAEEGRRGATTDERDPAVRCWGQSGTSDHGQGPHGDRAWIRLITGSRPIVQRTSHTLTGVCAN